MEDVIKRVSEVMCKTLKVDNLDPNKELKDLGLDSLDIVSLLLELEDEFGVEFSSDELKNFKKVQDFYDAIKEKISKK